MYKRTPSALVWIDTASEIEALGLQPADSRLDANLPRTELAQVLPAKKPFDGQLGRYFAIKRVAATRPCSQSGSRHLILVAVANRDSSAKGPRWIPAHQALTSREAALWAETGF